MEAEQRRAEAARGGAEGAWAAGRGAEAAAGAVAVEGGGVEGKERSDRCMRGDDQIEGGGVEEESCVVGGEGEANGGGGGDEEEGGEKEGGGREKEEGGGEKEGRIGKASEGKGGEITRTNEGEECAPEATEREGGGVAQQARHPRSQPVRIRRRHAEAEARARGGEGRVGPAVDGAGEEEEDDRRAERGGERDSGVEVQADAESATSRVAATGHGAHRGEVPQRVQGGSDPPRRADHGQGTDQQAAVADRGAGGGEEGHRGVDSEGARGSEASGGDDDEPVARRHSEEGE